MQPIDLVERLKYIQDLLGFEKLKNDFLDILLSQKNTPIPPSFKQDFVDILLDTIRKTSILKQDEKYKSIIEKFNIEEFFDNVSISKIIVTVNSINTLGDVYNTTFYPPIKNLEMFIDLFDKYILSLKYFLVDQKKFEIQDEEAETEFEIFDFDNNGFKFDDLINTLSNLKSIYNYFCEIYDVDISNLKIVYIESGSDINISFKGLAEPIKALNNLVKDWWFILRDRKNSKLERNIETALKLIDLDVKLNLLTEPEQKERIRKGIYKSLEEITGLGVMPKNMEIPNDNTKQVLLQENRNIKLLTEGNISSDNKEGNTDNIIKDENKE